MAKKLTNRELSDALCSIADEMVMMESKYEKVVSNYEVALDEIKELKKIIKSMAKITNYYDNSNTPPSADSIEWRKQKRQKDRERMTKIQAKKQEAKKDTREYRASTTQRKPSITNLNANESMAK